MTEDNQQVTAMQELINWLHLAKDNISLDNDYSLGMRKSCENLIVKATELLTKEREQIENAYCDGWVKDSPDAEDYFNNNYKQ